METPSVTTFKLSRHKKRGLFLTTILSALIGTGALYAANTVKAVLFSSLSEYSRCSPLSSVSSVIPF